MTAPLPFKAGESSQTTLQEAAAAAASVDVGSTSTPPSAARQFENGKEKAIAACLGALTTSLTMNPFDVIKTRLQTQHSLPSSLHLESPSTTTTAAIPASSNAVARLIRHEGFGVLWRGVGPAMVISMPSQASYMVGYDLTRRALLERPLPLLVSRTGRVSEVHRLGAPLVAGGLVRAGIAAAFSPIELLRTRLQSLPPSSSFGQVVGSTWELVRSQGTLSLWRGLPATLWRDVPFSALYWASYEVMQRTLTGSGFGETLPQTGNQTWAVAFTSGAVSGSVAAIFTHPFDVIKTRRQASSSEAAVAPQSTASMFGELYRRQGLAGLYSGLTPRLAKIAPACGLMISFYEIGLRWTLQKEEQKSLPH